MDNRSFKNGSTAWLFGFFFYASIILMPFSTIGCNASLIVTCALSSLLFIRSNKFHATLSIIPLAIFLVYILSFTYSSNLKAALSALDLWVFYLIVPLVFGLGGFHIAERLSENALKVFCGSVLAACLISYGRIVIQTEQFFPSNTDGRFTYFDAFSRSSFSEFLGIHPTYLSVYILFVVVVVFAKFAIKSYLKIGIAIVLGFFLIILSSKNQLPIFFVIISILLWRELQIKWHLKITVLVVVALSLLFVAANNSQLKYRFQHEASTALGDRMVLWSTGIQVIAENPILGVGIGDKKDTLNALLEKKNAQHLKGFNLHNQYLDFTLSFGLIGLALFLLILALPLIKHFDFTFCLFLFIVASSAFTESILFRQRGLVFFLMFYGLLSVADRYNLNGFINYRNSNR